MHRKGNRIGKEVLGWQQRPAGSGLARRGVHRTEKVEETFKLGIRVYEPGEDGTWRLTRQPAHYEAIGFEPMTIGWYGDHAFLIKDIKKVANI